MAVRLENKDHTFCRRTLALPVAPARRLNLRIQPGFRPIDHREIHIHARFDQAGGDHPARFSVFQPPPDFSQYIAAVVGCHQCGEVETAFCIQQIIDRLCLLPGAHNAEHLGISVQPGSKFLITESSALGISHPPEHRRICRRSNFPESQVGRCLPEQRFQCRLRGRTKNTGSPIVDSQLCNGPDTGLQIR